MQQIQHVVHKLVREETSKLEVGLFADENVRNLYIKLKTLATDCVESLYTLVKHDYAPRLHQARFTLGLDIFNNNNNIEEVTANELARATAMFPTINQEYQAAMIRYTHQLYGTMVGTLSLHILPFSTFLIRLYQWLSQTQEIRSLRYFTMSYIEQDLFFKDAVRLVMKNCMSVTPRVTKTQAHSNTTGTGGNQTLNQYDMLTQRHITPLDSVSNISARDPTESSLHYARNANRHHNNSQGKNQFQGKSQTSTSKQGGTRGNNPSTKLSNARNTHPRSRGRSVHQSQQQSRGRHTHRSRNRSRSHAPVSPFERPVVSEPEGCSRARRHKCVGVKHNHRSINMGSDATKSPSGGASSIMGRSVLEQFTRRKGAQDLPNDAPSAFLSKRHPPSGLRVVDTGNASAVSHNPVNKFYDEPRSDSDSDSTSDNLSLRRR